MLTRLIEIDSLQERQTWEKIRTLKTPEGAAPKFICAVNVSAIAGAVPATGLRFLVSCDSVSEARGQITPARLRDSHP